MDETAKTEARNYVSAAGFFVLAAVILLFSFPETEAGNFSIIGFIAGIGLLLAGTLLIILRKRDMIALLFMMLSFVYISHYFIPEFPGPVTMACLHGLVLITLLITLTGKDKAKWLLILLPLLMVIMFLIELLSGTRIDILIWLAVILALYFALACASERLPLPGRKLLTADEETDFKSSGSVLGYLLFAATTGMYAVYYIVGESMMQLEYLRIIHITAAILLIFIAVLLFAVAKMRFTPVMFLLLALTELLALYSTGSMFIGLGILVIIIGLFAVLRKESRILPGIMLLIYGCSYFVSAYIGGNSPVASIIFNGIPCLIAIYLAFVVYSQRNLPKF